MRISGLFRRRRQCLTIDEIADRSTGAVLNFGYLAYGGSRSMKREDSLRLPTVYRCVELISDGVAQLPLEPWDVNADGLRTRRAGDPVWHLLNCEPNPRMTRYTFIKTLVTSMLLQGNAYAYIQRDEEGRVAALHYIPAEYVTIVPPTQLDMPVTYSLPGATNIPATDMIHLINFTFDGINGISTIHHAATTLGIATEAEKQAKGFFEGGCNVGGILKSAMPLNKQQKDNLKASWAAAFGSKSGQPNGVAVLEAGLDYSPVTVNPRDAMLLESRMFSVVDICRFFGVSPTKCFDFSKSSYNTLEQTNLSFYTDTIAPVLRKIELEFERKIYPQPTHRVVDLRFDTNQLLRGDKAAQANFYRTLFSIGAISPNEVRREVGLPPTPGGDRTFVQVNMQTVEDAMKPRPGK